MAFRVSTPLCPERARYMSTLEESRGRRGPSQQGQRSAARCGEGIFDRLQAARRALTHTQDIFEAALFEAGDGLRTDHAAIGHHADPADSEALAQAVDHRDERGDVGGV